jgi:hypothetical protein
MVRKIGPSVKPVHNVAPIRTAIAHHRRRRAARRRNKIAKDLSHRVISEFGN